MYKKSAARAKVAFSLIRPIVVFHRFPPLSITRFYILFEQTINIIESFAFILGDPWADSGGEAKSKRAEKYGTKKSKERREEPLGQCLTRPVPNGRRRSGF